jgi:hypothetical protein
VLLETDRQIVAEALRIHQQTVITVIDQWYLAGGQGAANEQ